MADLLTQAADTVTEVQLHAPIVFPTLTLEQILTIQYAGLNHTVAARPTATSPGRHNNCRPQHQHPRSPSPMVTPLSPSQMAPHSQRQHYPHPHKIRTGRPLRQRRRVRKSFVLINTSSLEHWY